MIYVFLLIAVLLWYFWAAKKNKTEINSRPTADAIPRPLHTTDDDNAASSSEDIEICAPLPPERTLKGVRLHLRFQDREGAITERDVVTQTYAHDPATGNGGMNAFCQLRQAMRPFALKRIRQAIDLETGEIIPNLGAHLDALYEATPQAGVDRFLKEHSAAVFVLFSFAKADGAMRAKERAVIVNWAQAHGLEDALQLKELEDQVKGWYSTSYAFWDAVKTVVKEGKGAPYTTDLWAAVTAIVQSDKTPSEQEIKYLRYASKRLNQPMPVIGHSK